MKRLACSLLLLMMMPLAACGAGNGDYDVKHGGIGDTMSTKWFDFTVADAYSCGRYQSYVPSAGYELVVVTMTIMNNCGQPVEMRGDDFVICWGDDDDVFDEDIPLPAGLSGEQFPDEYVLGVNELKNGVLVFEVPREFREFTIRFMEPFESVSEADPDSDEGDTFFVVFTAEDRE